jgi:hypothetical protein
MVGKVYVYILEIIGRKGMIDRTLIEGEGPIVFVRKSLRSPLVFVGAERREILLPL